MIHYDQPPLAALDLRGTPADLAGLLAADSPVGVLLAVAGAARQPVHRLYFDTPSRDYRRAGLRVERRLGSGIAHDIVAQRPAADDLLAPETMKSHTIAAGDPARLVFRPAASNDPGPDDSAPLDLVLTLIAERWSRDIRYGKSVISWELLIGELKAAELQTAEIQATELKAAELQTGALWGGHDVIPVARLSLTLNSGERSDLVACARAIVSAADGRIWPDLQGFPHDRAEPGPVGKTPKTDLAGATSPGEALHAGLTALTRRITVLAPRFLDGRDSGGDPGGDPAAGWQLRIALRRWRALERVYRRVLRNAPMRDLNQSARICARLIGEVRDWDLYLSKTLSVARDTADQTGRADIMRGTDDLQRAAEAERDAARDLARRVMASKAFAEFLIDLIGVTALKSWGTHAREDLNGDLTAFSRAALDRCLDRAKETAAAIDPAMPDSLHALRLDLKKLRYTAQTFRQLYPKDIRRPYFLAMADLQDRLGDLNDAVTACDRTHDLAPDNGRAQPGVYGGQGANADARAASAFIIGYERARGDHAIEQAIAQWTDFLAMTPFWHAERNAGEIGPSSLIMSSPTSKHAGFKAAPDMPLKPISDHKQ